jgi:hypothetical protein
VLILCPLLLILYLGFLLLRPPPPEVWSSIRERLDAIAKERPLSTLLRPRWGNLSIVILYLVATALLNSPSQLGGMDSKSVVVSRQIPVALQMDLLGKIGAMAPLDALVGHFGIVPAYILLVFLGVAGLYLLTSMVAHALYLLLGSLAAVAGRLARWHGSGSGRRPPGDSHP